VLNQDVKRIMIVDDTSSITFALGEWIRNAGIHDVLTFEDPVEAVEEIRKNGTPDFIVTDYNMPGMNGVEFLDKVTSEKNVKAIIMTAYPDDVVFNNDQKTYEVIEKKIGFMKTILNKIQKIDNDTD
jgi:DNA-binding NtrC family response regulator